MVEKKELEKIAKRTNEINEYLNEVRKIIDFDNLPVDKKGEILFLFADVKRKEL